MSTDAMRAALVKLYAAVVRAHVTGTSIRYDHYAMVEARAALAQPASEPVAWVSVSTRLPEPDTPVLAHNGSWTGVGTWRSGDLEPTERWQDEHSEFIEHLGPAVTHWMPLPAGPAARAALAQTVSAVRVPLTESRILDLLSEHTTYDLQAGEEPPLVEDNYGSRRYASHFINFARAIERAHGIGEPK